MPTAVTKPRVIVCEGEADKSFFEHLINARNLPTFDVFEVKGRNNLGSFLSGLAVSPGLKTVSGILLAFDNEDEPDASFALVQRQIREAGGYGVPDKPLEVATAGNFPSVLIAMIPWVREVGNLESLCLDAVYETFPGMKQCLDDFCACASCNTWEASKLSKVRLQCAISSLCRSEPNTTLRYVWGQKDSPINLGHKSFDSIANLLKTFDQKLESQRI